MSDNKDIFYLDKVFPEPDKIFSADYKPLKSLFDTAIFIFDTNSLLVPFDTSEKNLQDIKLILLRLKKENKIFIPARVAREFAKNRATKLGDLFLSLRQLKNNLNSGTFRINEYPLLDGIEEYNNLKQSFSEIQNQIKVARQNIEKIEEKILEWSWNDAVSLAYKEIFTSELVIEPTITNKALEEDLNFRFIHKIAPGFKDSNKIDDGIGDLIIWHTILEIGKNKNCDVIFISNDEKNDWFYKQDKIGMYPKFELYDEFRRTTEGKSFSIISFLQFLQLSNANEETLKEVKQSLEENKIEEKGKFKIGLTHLVSGVTIEHVKFGIGIVVKTYNIGKQPIAEVDFRKHGIKKLMLNYAAIKVLNTEANVLLLSDNRQDN